MLRVKKIFFVIYILNIIFCSDILAQEAFIYDAQGKRNPFIPLITSSGRVLKVEQAEGMSGLLVDGIVFDKNGLSYALVNGDVVRIGDEIAGYQVLKIEKNKIVFIKDAEPLEIELKEEQ